MLPKNYPPMPDPNGTPEWADGTIAGLKFVGSLSLKIFAAGLATFIVIGVTARPTSGALRSQRIKWQERKTEIASSQAAAIDDQSTAEDAPTSEPAHD